MIVHWDQLVLHFGHEVPAHKVRFETAGESTYAMLCCRYSPSRYQVAANAAPEHAEDRLLTSDAWRGGVAQALASWTTHLNPIVVVLAVNRSPCARCTDRLIAELADYHRRFPVACDRARFILACRGLYSGRRYVLGTRKNAFPRLRDAGWEQCVLQMGGELPGVGKELLREIEPVAGRGILRLG